MYRLLLTLSPFGLALALLTAGSAVAQAPLAHPTRVGACDPRIDVCGLPPGGGALHYVDAPGSYRLGCDILVGPGQTGIAIGPNARSVVLDGDGFSVLGDPSHTSFSGIACLPAPAQRDSLVVRDVTLADFIDAGLSASNVGRCSVQDARLLRALHGMRFSDCGSVAVEGVSADQCGTGIDSTSVDALGVSGCVLVGNVTAVSVCGHSSRIQDVLVRGGSNGIVFEDSCFGPGGLEPFSLQCNDVQIEDVNQTGLTVLGSVARSRWIEELARIGVHGSGGDGISIAIPGSHELFLSQCSSSDNGGDGLKLTSASSGHVVLTGHDVSTNDNGGHGIEVDSSGDCSMSMIGGSSSHNGGDGVHASVSHRGDVVIKGIKVLQNIGLGGGVSGGSVDVTIADSSISDNGLRGLQVVATGGGPGGGGGGSLVLERSDLQGNGSDGCDLDCAALATRGRAAFSEVHCSGNAGRGLALHNVSATVHSAECSSNVGDGLQGQLSDVQCHLVTCSSNGGDGFHLADSSADLSACRARQNGGDGVDCSGALASSPASVGVVQCTLSDNQGLGMRVNNNAPPSIQASAVERNVSGGLSWSTSCAGCECSVTTCAFSSNGGVAITILSARGGRVSDCVVSGSSTGIHVGDPSGAGNCTGVRVSDNTVSSCATGIAVDANGHHLVVRNVASSCTTNFAVALGNMFGPVVTGADPGTNPNANLAP